MAYEVTARRWRPQEFDRVVGQTHVTTTLKNAIESGHVAHAYLFAGPRGVGKTTTARILAKALNCVQGPTSTPCNACAFCREITEGRSVDVLEIDGASNNKVEQIRTQLLESIKYTPSQGKHKIYIIDEVHMLTKEAFNALLKTLEEPPPHVYFIFATTDPQKVLPTILSRCQRFDFRRIAGRTIVDHLAMIAEHGEYRIERDALAVIARRADGSLRDAESLFDQVVVSGGASLTARDVASVLGMIEQDVYFELIDIIAEQDAPRGLQLIERVIQQGYDLDEIALGIIEHLRNLLIVDVSPDTPELLETAAVDFERYRAQSARFQTEDLLRLSRLAAAMEEAVKRSTLPKVQLEVGIVRMIRMEPTVLLTDVMKRLSALAQRLDGDAPEPAPSAPPLRPSESSRPSAGEAAREDARPARGKRPEVSRVSPAGGVTTSSPASPDVAASSGQTAGTSREAQAAEERPAGTSPSEERSGLKEMAQLWPAIRDRITRRRIALGNFLTAAAVVGYDDGVVTLGFGSRNEFHKQQAEKKEHAALIRETFADVIGAPVRVVCTTTEVLPPEAETPAPPEGTPSSTPSGQEMPAVQDPAVQRLLDAFDGTLTT